MITQKYLSSSETSRALQDLFYNYTHLPLGGKEIVCPYWINSLKRLRYGPGGGKGNPQENIMHTNSKAKEKNIDLNKQSEREIVLFMKKNRIGVDCSGFAFWMLNALDLEKGGNGIYDDIPNSRGKIIKIRASTKMLTDEGISFFVQKINEIKPGDMIRLRGGHHLAVVLEIEKDKDRNTQKIIYAHSSSCFFTAVSGVHKESIIIKDSEKSIQEQDWREQTQDKSNYANNLYPQAGDGIKRLKIWK